ncbi:MAG: hypothetical protein RLZZ584_840 [Pseudomonadota bacterium]|jgi:diguanylate cyclase (GGDEF)-like protein
MQPSTTASPPAATDHEGGQGSGRPHASVSPLGTSFERFARLQHHTALALAGFVLLLVLLLALQLWRSTGAVDRQRQLHAALGELNDLRQRAAQAESALGTYRATGNSALLRSVQPCAGQCLSSAHLHDAAPQAVELLTEPLQRIDHWAAQIDATLLTLANESMAAGRGTELVDDVLTQAARQLRINLQGMEAELLALLARSEAGRYHEAVLLQGLMASLALVALGGLVLSMRRAARLAAAGLLAEQALRELSLRDPLTGLPNRRALGLRLEHMIERAERHGGGPAVLAVDLDGFKLINDIYGHAAGDAALVEVAHRLLAALRKSDLPARVGGDEFVVLLDDPESPETARAVGERLLLALRAPINLPAPLGPVELGASVGLSHYPACGVTAQALLEVADEACLAAKRAGKNRLFESGPLPLPAQPLPGARQPPQPRAA